MSTATRLLALLVAAFAVMPPDGLTTGTATATLSMNAQIGADTSLRVSASQLLFEVSRSLDAAVVLVDFTAAARTRKDGEVLLTGEPAGAVDGPGGRAPNPVVVEYESSEGGSGVLVAGEPCVLGHWLNSGVRRGRLAFRLRGATQPGVYRLSVKFLLSTP